MMDSFHSSKKLCTRKTSYPSSEFSTCVGLLEKLLIILSLSERLELTPHHSQSQLFDYNILRLVFRNGWYWWGGPLLNSSRCLVLFKLRKETILLFRGLEFHYLCSLKTTSGLTTVFVLNECFYSLIWYMKMGYASEHSRVWDTWLSYTPCFLWCLPQTLFAGDWFDRLTAHTTIFAQTSFGSLLVLSMLRGSELYQGLLYF